MYTRELNGVSIFGINIWQSQYKCLTLHPLSIKKIVTEGACGGIGRRARLRI